MREFGNLVYNEVEKTYRKKRFMVIILILMVLVPLFIFAQYKQSQAQLKKLGTDDWKVVLQQKISDSQNRLTSASMPEEWQKYRKLQLQQQQYYLDHDINPAVEGAPTFVREFISQGIAMFIPLLVMIIAIDLISGEKADGTIKMLLTRPIRRWKILLGKYISLLLSISIIMALVLLISFLLSGAFFGFKGMEQPIMTGFTIENDTLVTASVHTIPQWKYILLASGLAWFVSVVIGTISFMVSVLIRNTPAGMGVMFASLIAGTILQELATNWEGVKYIYSVNLGLTNYLMGSVPSLQGLSMGFSLAILSAWGIASLVIAFVAFTREDMLA